ncbi:hypothetical protein ACODM8_07565 [Vibrio ostreicida]|uniref:hypothetical protein n=1 Tax=Vibrio ostreicida TaxID=526588 RepID=UPI0009704931|nr:hypothetical protein [Vibrio ostreicida]
MKHYQISKYGVHSFEEWTSITEIGDVFNDIELTREEYLRVENNYLTFIEKIIDCYPQSYQIKSIMDLRNMNEFSDISFNLLMNCIYVREGEYVDKEKILAISQLCLREMMGVRLESDSGSYITFGDDFYLRVGISEELNLSSVVEVEDIYIREMKFDPHS